MRRTQRDKHKHPPTTEPSHGKQKKENAKKEPSLADGTKRGIAQTEKNRTIDGGRTGRKQGAPEKMRQSAWNRGRGRTLLAGEENEDVPRGLHQVDLHDGDKGRFQVVCLGVPGPHNLWREQHSARRGGEGVIPRRHDREDKKRNPREEPPQTSTSKVRPGMVKMPQPKK